MAKPIRVDRFGGMIPRLDSRLLPQNAAEEVTNTDLSRGTIRGLHLPLRRATFDPGVIFAFRIFSASEGEVWLTNDVADTDVVPSPVIGDQFERWYWTDGVAAPQYSPIADIAAENPSIDLGVPGPVSAMTVGPPASSSDDETRVYVYTYVTEYGEESAPSPPSTPQTGSASGTWALSAIADVGGGNPTHYEFKRIYRTITGETSGDFFLVAEIPVADTTYNDTVPNSTAVLNSVLETEGWLPPPANLQGLTSMPNGILAGFVGRDVYFSVPYFPHAWPDDFVMTLSADVVALGVVGNTLCVATNSSPHAITGVTPEVMTAQKFDIVEPCMGKRSMVSFPEYCLYTSENGLVAIFPQDARVFSASFIDRDTWKENYIGSKQVQAVRYRDNQYLAYVPGGTSYLIHTQEEIQRFQEIAWDFPVDDLSVDYFSGVVQMVYQNSAYEFNPQTSYRYAAQWKSKVFELADPDNYGYVHIKFRETPEGLIDQGLIDDIIAYNTARIALPLQPIGWHAVGTVRKVDLGGTPLEKLWGQTKQPVGGSPLIKVAAFEAQLYTGTIYVYANGELKFQKQLTPEPDSKFRLPGGFKATYWQFQYIGQAIIHSVTLAKSGTDLRRI